MEDIEIRDVEARSRLELSVGDEVVAVADYRREPGRLVLPHTWVDPQHRGRGLAARVVGAALDLAHAEHREVVPQCSYVKRHLARGDRPSPDR